jgi:hypothetical protein
MAVEGADHVASKEEWLEGEVLFEGGMRRLGSINALQWRACYCILRYTCM